MGHNHSTKAAVFSTWLRGQMSQHKQSNRGLGKLVNPEFPERGRRKVLRHLSGKHFPSKASRAVYLEIFGLDGDPFTDDEVDEDQALARDLRDVRTLLARIERKHARTESAA